MSDNRDNTVEHNDEIPSVGDDTGKEGKNTTFIIAMVMLVLGAIGLLAMASGGTDDDGEKDKLDAWVEEEFDPASRELNLPSQRRYESEQSTPQPEYSSRAARMAAEQRALDQMEPPPGPNKEESREAEQERKRLEKMWEARRTAAPVVFGSGESSNASGENGRRGASGRSSGLDYGSITESLTKNLGVGGSKTPQRDKDLMDGRLNSSKTEAVTASFISDKPHTIAQGKIIGCVLETAMNSELPGMTRCVLTEDVYSFDGRQKLLVKGSRLVGQYEGGIQHGESRIFVIWTRIITPGGIDVALESPGVGSLGRAGHSAYIDSHFLERFGASSLLSIIGSLAASESDGDIRIEGVSDSFNESAEIALQESIRIRPTGHKNQGERVKVFVARDIDFGPVMNLARNQIQR